MLYLLSYGIKDLSYTRGVSSPSIIIHNIVDTAVRTPSLNPFYVSNVLCKKTCVCCCKIRPFAGAQGNGQSRLEECINTLILCSSVGTIIEMVV